MKRRRLEKIFSSDEGNVQTVIIWAYAARVYVFTLHLACIHTYKHV